MHLTDVVNRIQREGGSVVIVPREAASDSFSVCVTKGTPSGHGKEAHRYVQGQRSLVETVDGLWKELGVWAAALAA